MNASAIILAGGSSTRMRYNKEYIKLSDEYLVHKQINQLSSYFDEIIVVSDNTSHYADMGVRVVEDILHGKTPLIGLHSGLYHSSNKYNYCIACDMPYINFKFIEFLLEKAKGYDACTAIDRNFIEPFNAVYSKDIISKIEDFIESGLYGFQRFIKTLHTNYLSEDDLERFKQGFDMFTNINKESDLYDLGGINKYEYFDIIKVQKEKSFSIKDKIITEYPLSIFVNEKRYSVIVMTPEDIELMVIGYLYSEHVIKDVGEIVSFEVDIDANRCNVSLSHPLEITNTERLDILTSACGSSSSLKTNDLLMEKLSSSHIFDLNDILIASSSFNRESILFKETGGVHSVKLMSGNTNILFEDIGRHNAIDKSIGYLLKNMIDREDVFVITSGRISSDIVIKAALAKISLIVSRSAPTTLALKLAEKYGVTLIGFARGSKANIYTHKERIYI